MIRHQYMTVSPPVVTAPVVTRPQVVTPDVVTPRPVVTAPKRDRAEYMRQRRAGQSAAASKAL